MSSAVDPCSATFIYEYHYIYVMVCFSTSGSEFARLYGGEDGALGTPSRHQHSRSPMSLQGPTSSQGPGEALDLPPALTPDRCQFIIKFSPPEILLNWRKPSFYTFNALDDEIGLFHIENTCNCVLRFLYGSANGD